MLWTEERIATTVSRGFINAQLVGDERKMLDQSLGFGDALTDDTYVDWILNRARRLFLILVDVGVPDQIFGLVDESYDDEDLPIAEDAIHELRLSQDPNRSLDKKFYKAQYRYLIRDVKRGEHVRFQDGEIVPVEVLGLKANIVSRGKEGGDRVRLASSSSELFARKRVPIGQGIESYTEADMLSELATLKKLGHDHLISVFASYQTGNDIFVLLSPSAEYTLKSFIADAPKHYEGLPKPVRREMLLNWPHCLANAVAWLHGKRISHGAIRPSNIFLDSSLQIYLGQFESFNITNINKQDDDVELYQYAAPERWKRAATMQKIGPGNISLPSGGRTHRKQSDAKRSDEVATRQQNRNSWDSQNTSTSPQSVVSNSKSSLQIPKTSFAQSARHALTGRSTPKGQWSIASSGSSGSKSRPEQDDDSTSYASMPAIPTRSKIASFASNTIIGSDTSGNTSKTGATLNDPIILAPREVRTAIVQKWHSSQFDPLPADIFALGAITIDILTFLCKRSAGSFTRFRAAKNRNAGRGGGLADASFHANLGQVLAWTTMLQHDARKKVSKEPGGAFGAVVPVIEVALRALERNPENRIGANELESQLGGCIWKSGTVTKLHCYKAYEAPTGFPPEYVGNEPDDVPNEVYSEPPSTILDDSPPMLSPDRRQRVGGTKKGFGAEETRLGPESSFSSLSSFNFNQDFGGDAASTPDSSKVSVHYPDDHIIDFEYLHESLDVNQSRTTGK